MSVGDTNDPSVKHGTSGFGWRAGSLVLILGLGAIALCCIQVFGLSVWKPAQDTLLVLGLINLFMYLWIRSGAKLSILAQIASLVFLVALQIAIGCALRVDGFDGNGNYIFKWRWTPTPEQQLARFESHSSSSTETIDLCHQSPFDVPAFRGHRRDGWFNNPRLDLDWQTRPPRELWRRPMGRGWSSFAVVGQFAVTQEQLRDGEAVSCYRLETGELMWRHLTPLRFDEVTSGPGPRATPTIHGGRVFALGATGTLTALDGATGACQWQIALCPPSSKPALFGYASSPLVVDNKVIVTLGAPAPSIVAVDSALGDILWSAGRRHAGYSSPQLFFNRGVVEVLCFDAQGLFAYELENGTARWRFDWGDNSQEHVNVCQPADLGDSQIMISSGYGRGSVLLKIKDQQVNELWRTKRLRSKFASLVFKDGFAYGLDEGVLTCIDMKNGERRWKRGRYGHGQLIRLNDKLLVQAESGGVFLVDVEPDRARELATLQGLQDRTWNHPVVAGRYCLLRNDREAVCYELPLKAVLREESE